jgi:hypothetical protein
MSAFRQEFPAFTDLSGINRLHRLQIPAFEVQPVRNHQLNPRSFRFGNHGFAFGRVMCGYSLRQDMAGRLTS